jgi:putative membrane protein
MKRFAPALYPQPRTAERPLLRVWPAAVAGLILFATATLFVRYRTPVRMGLNDPTIVAIFDAANTADIETGRLAAERAHSQEVREFGSMLARDHQQFRQLGRDLASRLGVTPTPPKDDPGATAHARAIALLRTKTGADFDRAFLQHEVDFHKSVTQAVQTTLLPAIDNEELRGLVVRVAPAFHAHMLAAENLERRVRASAAANGVSEDALTLTLSR